MNENINLIVKYEPITLTTNFDEIKQAVKDEVEKYSISVTDENLTEAKKVMATFNKVKAEINEKFNEYIKKLSAPIDELKSQKKEIENIITEGRSKIANQVAVYEANKLEAIKESIKAYIDEICKQKEINTTLLNADEFIKLTAVTSNGTLTKATKEAIEAKIGIIKNEILKAKLEAQAKAEREREIAEQARVEAEAKAEREKAEIEAKARQREAQLKEQMEREKAEAIEQAKEQAKAEALNSKSEVVKTPPRLSDDGKMIYTIRAEFEVKAVINAPHDLLCEKLKDMLSNAGISPLKLEVLNAKY